MSEAYEGGCLCGSVRYKASDQPQRVTMCHCTFCQRFTGSAFLVEPVFRKSDISFSGDACQTYQHRSDGSGKIVTLHFCGKCGTTLYLSFERFPDTFGFCGGTFDDPNWFERSKKNCRHIYTRSIQRGVVVPAGFEAYVQHRLTNDGTPNEPTVYAHAMMLRT